MTPDDLLTRKDLAEFKKELFELLAPLSGKHIAGQQKWLKNKDVTAMLGISHGTLQNLRVNGTLPFNKVGGTYFYKPGDIDKMLAGAEKKSPNRKV